MAPSKVRRPEPIAAPRDTLEVERIAGPAVGPTVVAAPRTPSAKWPCGCGEQVPLEQSVCPVCGSAFLQDLTVAAESRRGAHRTGLRWPQSRRAGLALAGGIGIVIAVAVPLLLALIG